MQLCMPCLKIFFYLTTFITYLTTQQLGPGSGAGGVVGWFLAAALALAAARLERHVRPGSGRAGKAAGGPAAGGPLPAVPGRRSKLVTESSLISELVQASLWSEN